MEVSFPLLLKETFGTEFDSKEMRECPVSWCLDNTAVLVLVVAESDCMRCWRHAAGCTGYCNDSNLAAWRFPSLGSGPRISVLESAVEIPMEKKKQSEIGSVRPW